MNLARCLFILKGRRPWLKKVSAFQDAERVRFAPLNWRCGLAHHFVVVRVVRVVKLSRLCGLSSCAGCQVVRVVKLSWKQEKGWHEYVVVQTRKRLARVYCCRKQEKGSPEFVVVVQTREMLTRICCCPNEKNICPNLWLSRREKC